MESSHNQLLYGFNLDQEWKDMLAMFAKLFFSSLWAIFQSIHARNTMHFREMKLYGSTLSIRLLQNWLSYNTISYNFLRALLSVSYFSLFCAAHESAREFSFLSFCSSSRAAIRIIGRRTGNIAEGEYQRPTKEIALFWFVWTLDVWPRAFFSLQGGNGAVNLWRKHEFLLHQKCVVSWN